MPRPARRLLAVLAAVGGLAGCGDGNGTVQLTFRPDPGDEFDYVTEIESETVTALPGRAPETREDRARLSVHQVVLEADDDGALVEVELERAAIGSRTFVVRLDRAAQLTRVEEVEGIPAEALGDLGISEIFPPAAGAPPPGALAPGDRWEIDEEVALDADTEASRLTGSGRLVSLGVEDGVDVATVVVSTRLAVRTESSSSSGTRSLDGAQRAEVEAVYDLRDGSLVRATSITIGSFDLVLGPPEGTDGRPVRGRLRVEVRSEITRSPASLDG